MTAKPARKPAHKRKPPGKKPRDPLALTEKEALFVGEYMIDHNATQAAIRAGFSEKTAAQQGYQLLHKPSVAAAVRNALEERQRRLQVDADGLLARLVEEADADLADLFDDLGNLKPIKEWPKVWRRGLVSGLETISFDVDDDEGDVEESLEPQGHGGALKRAKKDKPRARLHKLKLSERIKRVELIGRHRGVQAFKDRVDLGVSEPLKKLYEQIAGQSIRPQEPG